MKLFVSYSERDDASKYVSNYILAESEEDAILKLYEKGVKPDTWCGKFIVAEILNVIK